MPINGLREFGTGKSDALTRELPFVLTGLSMIAVAYGFARFSYGLFLPQFRSEFALSSSLLGLIAGGSYLGYCFAIVAASMLSPRYGPRNVVILAGVVAAIGMAVVGSAGNGAMLAFGVLLAGMSTGLASPPMGDAVKYQLPTPRQAPANSWINSGTSLGVLISAPIALLAGEYWRVAWVTFAGLAVLSATLCYFVLPGSKKRSEIKFSGVQWKHWINRHSLPLLYSSFMMGFASSVYWTFSRDYLVEFGTMSADMSLYFWAVIGISGFLGGLAGGFVKKVGILVALRTSLLGFGISIGGITLFQGGVTAAFISGAFFGALYIMLTGIFLIWSVAVYSAQPSMGIALSFMTIALGQVIGAPFSGWIAETFGIAQSFWILGLTAILATVIRPHSKEIEYFEDLVSERVDARNNEVIGGCHANQGHKRKY